VNTRRITVIINPISGTGAGDSVERRINLARALAARHDVEPHIVVSERPQHARELARDAVAAGITDVVAWGGDGTLNEVGSELVGRDAVLAVIPSGSGNGLARELGIPLQPDAAFEIALSGRERVIDAGEIDGHLFFNIAGIGLDARVAHEFAAHGLRRRGFRRYIEITLRELFRYAPDEHAITVNGSIVRSRMLMIAIANARQYGNGALIAPQALLDDGQLDVVVIDNRPVWRALMQIPRIFTGEIAKVPGVTMLRGDQVTVTSGRPVVFHVDGEPFVGSACITARVHPRALRVRVPGNNP
jgi:YegS/Rv2252/BmrU family lipid kinase